MRYFALLDQQWYTVNMDGKKLPDQIKKIVLALSPELAPIPADIDQATHEEFVIHEITKLIYEIPLFFRWGLFASLWLFNVLPVFSGYGFKRFISQPADKKNVYIRSWADSRHAFKRDVFKAVKGIIALVTLSHSVLWKEMGYEPQSHLEERINLRQKIINEKRTINNS